MRNVSYPLQSAEALSDLSGTAASAGLLRIHMFVPLPCLHWLLLPVQVMASV